MSSNNIRCYLASLSASPQSILTSSKKHHLALNPSIYHKTPSIIPAPEPPDPFTTNERVDSWRNEALKNLDSMVYAPVVRDALV